MIRLLARNIIRFFILILVQVLLLDNVLLGGYLNPYFYVLFILLMPFETPRWLLLVAGFLLGLSMDIFTNTLGMQTAATVLMAFMRPWVLSMFAPRDGYEPETYPRIHYYGLGWFAGYAVILTFLHHLVLFYVEVFHFQYFFTTLLRVILSTALTTSTIILSQFFIFRK
ncbi:MAG: rod shape-determining protein MreD [Bacteroidales bacterium]|nr:rod shape-determining protein MreD [Bacteroidales bacterium]MDT8432624.1 rod shape-determining protein MreD [Bacteroidales bacterium]